MLLQAFQVLSNFQRVTNKTNQLQMMRPWQCWSCREQTLDWGYLCSTFSSPSAYQALKFWWPWTTYTNTHIICQKATKNNASVFYEVEADVSSVGVGWSYMYVCKMKKGYHKGKGKEEKSGLKC